MYSCLGISVAVTADSMVAAWITGDNISMLAAWLELEVHAQVPVWLINDCSGVRRNPIASDDSNCDLQQGYQEHA
jgi:hypothetical protein